MTRGLTRRSIPCGILLTTIALAGLAAPVEAQLTRGAVVGTVMDETGGVIPGVTVTVTNHATNAERLDTTNDVGFYRVGALEPGRYSVRIELMGFRAVENQDVIVVAGQETTFNASLDPGGLDEVVDVTAVATGITLDRTNPTIGTIYTQTQLTEVPLSATRDINSLVLFTPGAHSGPVSSSGGGMSASGATGFSVAGQRGRNNNFLIDGTDNNDASVSTSTITLPPEAVAEFQVLTNAYNAEYGRSTGGQFNAITRSGSNRFTGDLWNHYDGSELNALDNLQKEAGFDSPPRENRNQFGGAIGGPLVRNQTFFFGLYDGTRFRRAGELGAVTRIPTPAGLSALQNAPLGGGQSAESRQATLDALGFLNDVHADGPVLRDVHSDISVNGVPIETANVQVGRPSPQNIDKTFGRIDQRLGDNSTLTGRYIFDQPETLNTASNTAFGTRFAANSLVRDQNLAISETRILRPNMLNEVRFGYIRRNLQFPENEPDLPTGAISGLFTIGGLSNFPQGRLQNSFQLQNVVSQQAGRHSLKYGGDVRYLQLDNSADFNIKGTFNFDNLEAFLNNQATSFTQALQTASFDARQWQLFFFVQDDFRVTPNLTLNLGLRYENNTVPFGFFGATDPEVQAARVPGPTRRDNNNWAPRVGFAWSPEGRSGLSRLIFGENSGALTGGYGINYDVLFFNILTVNASNFPRVQTGREDNVADVFPNILPTEAEVRFVPTDQFVNAPENAQNPMSHRWSLTVRRELAREYVVEVGYNGTLSRHGVRQMHTNPGVLTAEQAALVRETQDTTAIPTVQARREDPAVGPRILIDTGARGEYHAGFVRVNKRLSRDLQIGADYTYSAAFSDNDESLAVGDITTSSPQTPQDFNNIDAEWSRSAFDRPHVFTVNWTYLLPRLQGMPAVLRQVAGGWQLSGGFSVQSGQPFGIRTGVDANGDGVGNNARPDLNPNGTLTPDPATGNLRSFTTENMFIVPRNAAGQPLAFSMENGGDLGRNTFRGPGRTEWTFRVSKWVPLLNHHRIRIAADFFNAFNQRNFANPIADMNDPNFGQNTSNGGNRTIALSAKYTF